MSRATGVLETLTTAHETTPGKFAIAELKKVYLSFSKEEDATARLESRAEGCLRKTTQALSEESDRFDGKKPTPGQKKVVRLLKQWQELVAKIEALEEDRKNWEFGSERKGTWDGLKPAAKKKIDVIKRRLDKLDDSLRTAVAAITELEFDQLRAADGMSYDDF